MTAEPLDPETTEPPGRTDWTDDEHWTDPPTCPRCGGVHPEMYESAAWAPDDDDGYEWTAP